MKGFYELTTDSYHLEEYDEYYCFKEIMDQFRPGELQRLEEYHYFDMRLCPFEGSGNIQKDAESEKYRITYPDRLFFTGDFHNSKVESTDYPIVDQYQLLVISKKLLSVIDSVKSFKRHTVPTVIFDFLADNPFLCYNKLPNGVKHTTDYVYVKLFQFVLLNKVHSSRHGYNVEIIEPEQGLDPLFRVRQLPGRVFVTEAVRNAIETYNRVVQKHQFLNNSIKKTEDKIRGIRLCDGAEWIDFH